MIHRSQNLNHATLLELVTQIFAQDLQSYTLILHQRIIWLHMLTMYIIKFNQPENVQIDEMPMVIVLRLPRDLIPHWSFLLGPKYARA